MPSTEDTGDDARTDPHAYLSELSEAEQDRVLGSKANGQAFRDGADMNQLINSTQQLEIESATPGTHRWLADLPGGDGAGGYRPRSMAVGGQALRSADGRPRRARSRSRACSGDSGNWVVLHGATLVGDRHSGASP